MSMAGSRLTVLKGSGFTVWHVQPKWDLYLHSLGGWTKCGFIPLTCPLFKEESECEGGTGHRFHTEEMAAYWHREVAHSARPGWHLHTSCNSNSFCLWKANLDPVSVPLCRWFFVQNQNRKGLELLEMFLSPNRTWRRSDATGAYGLQKYPL